MVDIKLDNTWGLTQAANGDAPVISDVECLIQDIKLEAITQAGELFYDTEYGWSLLEFIQSEDNELTHIEINERIRSKLSKRNQIDIESIRNTITFKDDVLNIEIAFRLINDSQTHVIDIVLNRIKVEVKDSD